MLDDQDKFHLQRRNLIIVSTITLFYEIGDLQPSKEANLLFTDLTINNTSAIEVFLHGMLLYFIWRYIVSFQTLGGINRSFENYKAHVRERMSSLAFKKAKNYLKTKKIEFVDVSQGPKFKENNNWFLPFGKNQHDPYQKGAEYSFEYGIKDSKNTYKTVYFDKKTSVKGLELQLIKLNAFIRYVLFTNLFLEFYMPFVLAIFALTETFDFHISSFFIKALSW